MINNTIADRTLKQALDHAAKTEQELPQIVQVYPSDWDIVILANEVKRLMINESDLLYGFLQDYFIFERTDLHGKKTGGYEFGSGGSVGGHMQRLCLYHIIEKYGRGNLEKALIKKDEFVSYLYSSDGMRLWKCMNEMNELLEEKIKEIVKELRSGTL